jgi:hypothetical protein
MASSKGGQVTLSGRFPVGARVELVRVAGAHVLRSEGGKVVDSGTVDENGQVRFSKGVEVGARYFIRGYRAGVPLEVRVRGNKASEDTGLAQAPVGPDRVRLGDGSWEDEAPEAELEGVVPGGPAQEHARDVQQRSSTARGYATPVDPDERGPYPSQDEERFQDGSTPQRSDTPEGLATPFADVPARQEDVPEGVQQRSNTRTGVATPLVPGDPVDASRAIHSAEAKAIAGDPQKAAAHGIAPGESIPSDGEPHVDLADQDEQGSSGRERLSGQALKDRARELDIKGRGSMTASKLRAAITRAENKQ